MTFEQQFDAARYNEWYWVSYGAMILAPGVGTVAVTMLLRAR